MSRRDEIVLERFRRCREECLSGETTAEQRMEYQILHARQVARDEAKRQPSPQLPIELAA
jgi:hypothetical protein